MSGKTSCLLLLAAVCLHTAQAFTTPSLLPAARASATRRTSAPRRGLSLAKMVATPPKTKAAEEEWTSFFPQALEECGFEGNKEMRAKMERMLRQAQIKVCSAVEESDGQGKFQEDKWERPGGGGGLTRVLSGGKVWEKAGCNLAVVHGSMPASALNAANDKLRAGADYKPGDQVKFFACGLSSVMHPKNPHCPTMHFNYRYFETEGGQWWFGGGTDITPSYLDEADMKHFHGTYKEVCDRHDLSYYDKFKKWADEYFLISHRGETRGLGGIFFDDLNDGDVDKLFSFCEDAAMHVPEAYIPIIDKHKNDAFTEQEKQWQLIRRGRYVEFNLVYDRGTIFGLKTGGRTESILMTLPETARWEYDHHPKPGSPEADIMDAFKNPREWA